MPLEIPVERIVQRGLTRFQIRKEYEGAFRQVTLDTLKSQGHADFITLSGKKLLSTRTPRKWNFSHLPREDQKFVERYSVALHKRARYVAAYMRGGIATKLSNARLKVEGALDRHLPGVSRSLTGVAMPNRFFMAPHKPTPFGIIGFTKPPWHSLDLDINAGGKTFRRTAIVYTYLPSLGRTRAAQVRRIKEEKAQTGIKSALDIYREFVAKARVVAVHEAEHLHSHLLIKSTGVPPGAEPRIVNEIISFVVEGKPHSDMPERRKEIIDRAKVFVGRPPESDRLLDKTTALMLAISNLSDRLDRDGRKQFATILSDPAVKTLDDAREVIEHLEKNRHLLKS